MNPDNSIKELFDLVTTLRSEKGCPWDRKQTAQTISVYLIEEMYELVEALAADRIDDVVEEMGDVLFQIVFLMRLYAEQGRFTFQDVVQRSVAKMVRRHPHVFGADKVSDAAEVKKRWREIKRQEKGDDVSLLDSIPNGMPALMRAYRVSERAAATGFDWDSLNGVLKQVESEWAEFKAELTANRPADRSAAMELGDILFTLVNVGRLAGIHPETALAQSTQKFIDRFKGMESLAARQHRRIDEVSRVEMEKMWQAVKRNEANSGGVE